MKLTASKLRQDIYRILDQVIKSGKPVEIERNGTILKIEPAKRRYRKLDRLKAHKFSDEDPESFCHIDWSDQWSEQK